MRSDTRTPNPNDNDKGNNMSNKLNTLFKKIADAANTGGGNNIRDGIYKLAVEQCVLNDEAHSGTVFIVEFRVMEASPSGALDEQGRPVTPNQVGTSCSMVCNVTKHESAFGNLKKFLVGSLAGLGYSADQVTEDLIKQVFVDDPKMLRGVVVRDETYRSINKGRVNTANAGKPLTLNKWIAVEQTEEDIAKMRAYLDSSSSITSSDVKTDPTIAQAAQPAGKGMLSALKR